MTQERPLRGKDSCGKESKPQTLSETDTWEQNTAPESRSSEAGWPSSICNPALNFPVTCHTGKGDMYGSYTDAKSKNSLLHENQNHGGRARSVFVLSKCIIHGFLFLLGFPAGRSTQHTSCQDSQIWPVGQDSRHPPEITVRYTATSLSAFPDYDKGKRQSSRDEGQKGANLIFGLGSESLAYGESPGRKPDLWFLPPWVSPWDGQPGSRQCAPSAVTDERRRSPAAPQIMVSYRT